MAPTIERPRPFTSARRNTVHVRIVDSPATAPQALGPCQEQFCSCRRFVYTNDAQFCDNCGHSRSRHGG